MPRHEVATLIAEQGYEPQDIATCSATERCFAQRTYVYPKVRNVDFLGDPLARWLSICPGQTRIWTLIDDLPDESPAVGVEVCRRGAPLNTLAVRASFRGGNCLLRKKSLFGISRS
jgi:hypothetical protein